jgi:hypothetical protein
MTHLNILEKVSNILQNLTDDIAKRKVILSRYKSAHCLLNKGQLVLNSLSVGCGSSAAVSFASGIGSPAGMALSITTVISAGLGVFFQILDGRVLHKIHKHYQLHILSRTLDLNLFQTILSTENLKSEDFNKVVTMMSQYYKERDLIETKSLFVNNNITELSKEFKNALEFEAIKNGTENTRK